MLVDFSVTTDGRTLTNRKKSRSETISCKQTLGHKKPCCEDTNQRPLNPAAFYSDNEISVRLPETVVLARATTEQILNDGEKLTLLVEKDFADLAPRPGEDESDMYPHPNEDSADC